MNKPVEQRTTNSVNPILAKFGITPEQIEATRKAHPSTSRKSTATHRAKHIRDIQEHGPAMIKDNNGNPLMCSSQVLHGLLKRGCARTKSGAVMKDSKGLGDTLGGHGLKLPYTTFGTTRYYLLSMVNATEEEKQKAQAELNSRTPDGTASHVAGVTPKSPNEDGGAGAVVAA